MWNKSLILLLVFLVSYLPVVFSESSTVLYSDANMTIYSVDNNIWWRRIKFENALFTGTTLRFPNNFTDNETYYPVKIIKKSDNSTVATGEYWYESLNDTLYNYNSSFVEWKLLSNYPTQTEFYIGFGKAVNFNATGWKNTTINISSPKYTSLMLNVSNWYGGVGTWSNYDDSEDYNSTGGACSDTVSGCDENWGTATSATSYGSCTVQTSYSYTSSKNELSKKFLFERILQAEWTYMFGGGCTSTVTTGVYSVYQNGGYNQISCINEGAYGGCDAMVCSNSVTITKAFNASTTTYLRKKDGSAGDPATYFISDSATFYRVQFGATGRYYEDKVRFLLTDPASDIIVSYNSTWLVQDTGSYEDKSNKIDLTNYFKQGNNTLELYSSGAAGGGLKMFFELQPDVKSPSIVSGRIQPTTAYKNDTLNGYCNATDQDSATLTYYYGWYKNGVLNQSGSISLLSGSEVNVNNLSSSYLSKNQNWTFSCMASDGYFNTSWTNSSQITINNFIPILSSASISTTLYTDNIVNCTNSTVTDIDNDTISFFYEWYKNSIIISGETNYSLNLSKAGNGDKGDNIYCKAKPNDGTVNGSIVQSNTVAISNSKPISTTTPSLNNTTPKITDTLSCSGYTYYDADSDALSFVLYAWYQNGTVISGQIASTLNLNIGGLHRGDNITCGVKLNDGSIFSDIYNTTAATIQNTQPSFTQQLSDINITPNQNLSTQVNCTDIDSDTILYYVNSSLITINSSGYLFDDPSQSDIGTYSIKVTCGDGQANVTSNFTYTIRNTAPTFIVTPSINNSAPSVIDVVLCNYTATDIENDTITPSFKWYNSSNEIAGQTSQTFNLSGSGLIKNNNLSCSIRLYDGNLYSNWTNSSSVAVGNSLPRIMGTPIINISAPTPDIYSCDNVSTYDADGDTVNISYEWYIRDSPIANQTSKTIDLSLGYINRSTNLSCWVRPYDGMAYGAYNGSDQYIVGNIPAIAINVTLNTSTIDRNKNATCNYTIFNIDGDNITASSFKWYKNSVEINGATTQTVQLSTLSLSIGDILTCGVALSDVNLTSGYRKSSNITIVNHIPDFTINITPNDPSLGDDLNCTITAETDVDGDSENYTFVWSHDGTVLTRQNNTAIKYFVLSSNYTASNEAYTCNVTQIEYNSTATISNTTKSKDIPIGNVPPVMVNISVEDLLYDSVVPITVTATDLNNDPLTYTCGYKIDSATNYTYFNASSTNIISWDVSLLSEGNYNLKCYAEDPGTTSEFMTYTGTVKVKHLTVSNLQSDKGLFLTKYTIYAPYTYQDSQYTAGLDSQMIGDDTNNNILSAIFYTQEATTKIKSFTIKPFHQYKNDASLSSGYTDPIYSLQLMKVAKVGDITGNVIWRKDSESFQVGQDNTYTLNLDVDEGYYAMKVCIADAISGVCNTRNPGKIDSILIYSSNSKGTYTFKTLTNSIAYEKYDPNIVFSYARDSFTKSLTKITNPYESLGFAPSIIRRDNEADNLCGDELAVKMGLPQCITKVNGEYYFQNNDPIELGETKTYYVIYSRKDDFTGNSTSRSVSFIKSATIDPNLKLNVYGQNALSVDTKLNTQSVVQTTLLNGVASSQDLSSILTSSNTLLITSGSGITYVYFEPQFGDLVMSGLPETIYPVENGYRRTIVNLLTTRNVDVTGSSCKITKLDNSNFSLEVPVQPIQGVTGNYTCTFDMQYNYFGGIYKIRATTLEKGVPDYVEDTFTYAETKALTIGTLIFDDTEYSDTEQYITDSFTIKNTGNLNVSNVSMALVEQYYWNLDEDNIYFKIKGNTWWARDSETNLDKSRYKYDLTDTQSLVENLGVGETKTIYVKIKIPAKQAPGQYDTELETAWG